MLGPQEAPGHYAAWKTKLTQWLGETPVAPLPEETRERIRSALVPVVISPHISTAQSEELLELYARLFDLNPEEAQTELTPRVERADDLEAVTDPPLPEGKFLQRYVSWLSEQESPVAYHVFALLTVYSAAFRRSGKILVGGLPVYPNLYTVLLGPSGSRKDSACDYAIRMVTKDWDMNVLTGEGSIQGIADSIAARYTQCGTGDILIVMPEMKVLFGDSGYNKLVTTWLTDWYKCQPEWKRPLRSEEVLLRNLYPCLLAGTTKDWLMTMSEDVVTGGFLFGRALVIPASGKKHWKLMPRVEMSEFVTLGDHVYESLIGIPEQYIFSPEAERYFRWWYEEELPKMFRLADARMQTFINRAHVYVMKLSVLLHQLDYGGAEIREAAVKAAIDLITWAMDLSLPLVGALDVREPVYEDLLALLRKHGKLPLRDVTRKLRNRYGAEQVRRAVDALHEEKSLRLYRVGGCFYVTPG